MDSGHIRKPDRVIFINGIELCAFVIRLPEEQFRCCGVRCTVLCTKIPQDDYYTGTNYKSLTILRRYKHYITEHLGVGEASVMVFVVYCSQHTIQTSSNSKSKLWN